MPHIKVNNVNQLMNALKTASKGDVIALESGVYNNIVINNMKLGGVTITSSNTDKPAVINNIVINGSSGININNVEFEAKKDLPLQVIKSSNINIDNVFVHGTINGSSHDDARGMIVRWSSNVTVTNSHFTELTDAITQLESDNVTISNNVFQVLRDNGIVGGGMQKSVIKNNYFTDFDHIGDVHPDAIQFWTTGASRVNSDVVIDGNVFDRGNGAAVQGVQMRDEKGGMTYERVTITNNTIIGAMMGINVADVNTLTVNGNTVLGYEDQASRIAIRNSKDVVATGNISSGIDLSGQSVKQSANIEAAAATTAVASSIGKWIDNSSYVGNEADLSGFAFALRGQVMTMAKLLGYVDGAPQNSAQGGALFSETVLTGTASTDILRAGKQAGDFRLLGGAGDDQLVGGGNGVGKNHLVGGMGNDKYTVYHSGDMVYEAAGQGVDTVSSFIDYTLGANIENLDGQKADLVLRGNELDNSINVRAGSNKLHGEGGNDLLQGGIGDDFIFGGDGNDRLIGKDGNDRLDGGNGNDQIEGGSGADVLFGGRGADIFFFRPADIAAGPKVLDTIGDFSRAEGDRVNLGSIDANSNTSPNNAFTFIGSNAFQKIGGQLRYTASGNGVDLMGDINGDGAADFTIHFTGVNTLHASDFFL